MSASSSPSPKIPIEWSKYLRDYFPAVISTVLTFYFGFEWAILITPALYSGTQFLIKTRGEESRSPSDNIFPVIVFIKISLFLLRFGLEIWLLFSTN